MFTAQSNFIIALILFSIGAASSLFFYKKNFVANLFGSFLAAIGSIFALLSSIPVLLSHNNFTISIPSTFPLLSFSFKMDSIAAFFVSVISLIALVASIYGFGYIKQYYGKYNIGSLGFFYNTFIASMLMVATAHNALFFLIVWEIMSLSSYFLVIFEKNEPKNIAAGTLYFIMTHAGTAFITLAFLLLYQSTGSLDFEVIKNNISLISPLTKDTIFILALIGFGTKAGIIPFHIWLPSAHPAAPSHVSALMSGVMIKTGIYMIMRLFIDMIPNFPAWWGVTILIIGAISSLLGVLYALSEHDIKKLLAYHSIENIGIILLGLGSSLVFRSLGFQTLAIISLVAALFHTLNHAVFKALLFMGAGSVISKTHTKNIEEYGGLIKLMPLTAIFFLIGSMAISALPPFNGFASEWLTFQSLFAGIQSSNMTQWAFIISAGSLAFTGGLAAACFVKVFGITFLARPRSEKVQKATEVSFSLQFGMATLALLSLVFGVFSGPISSLLSKIADNFIITENTSTIFQTSPFALHSNIATISMPKIFLLLAVILLIAYLTIKMVSQKQKIKENITWDCGTNLGPRMEITATGFSRSIITIFSNILQPTKDIEVVYSDTNNRYFPKKSTVRLEIKNIYKSYFYQPLQLLITKLSSYAKYIQSGNVNAYIFYIFAVLIILLITGVI